MGEPYWARRHGDAGDALDFACGHCDPDEALAFLNDWREGAAEEWPGFMKWLKVQQDGAKAIADRSRQAETVKQGSVHESSGAEGNRTDEITVLQQRVKQLEEGLERIADRCAKLRNGTDDWFELVEIEMASRSLLSDKGED